jgi:2-methylisocitrate lyase-like PEP mutase family enzyme
MTQREKAEAFRALHEGDPFLFPNPWDAGSARMLEAVGFKALATTSSGFAFTRGKLDGGVTLDEVVEHVALLCGATSLPVAVDLENGYEAPSVAIARVAQAGAVGGSIEDYDPAGRLYPVEEAVERLSDAIATARALDFPFTLTARAEGQLRDPDLDDTIARLQAFERAGADVLFAPGLRTADEVRAVCSAVGRPVNVLGHRGLTMAEIAAAGGQRVSIGGALTWVAVSAAFEAAQKLRDGDLSVLTARLPLADWLT